MPALPMTEERLMVLLPRIGTLTVMFTPLSSAATADAIASDNPDVRAVAPAPVVAELK